MTPKLAELPELPAEPHPFALVPEQRLPLPAGALRPRPAELAYRRCGQGQAVVIAPGLWGGAFGFGALLEPLPAAGCELTLLEPLDALGDNPLADYTPENLAGLLAEALDGLGLARVILVAEAECALAGMWLALRQPERIACLIAIDLALRLPTGDRLRGWHLAHEGACERWARRCAVDPIQAALGLLTYADLTVASRQEVRYLARAFGTLPAARARTRVLARTLATDYRAGVEAALDGLSGGQGFPVPLKLVFGGANRRAPATLGETLCRRFPGAEWLVSETPASRVPAECPRWLERIIVSTRA